MVEYMIVLGAVALGALAALLQFGQCALGLGVREGDCVRTFQCGPGTPFPEGGGTPGASDTPGASGTPGASATPGPVGGPIPAAPPPPGREIHDLYVGPIDDAHVAALRWVSDPANGRDTLVGFATFEATGPRLAAELGLVKVESDSWTLGVGVARGELTPTGVGGVARLVEATVRTDVNGVPVATTGAFVQLKGGAQLGRDGVDVGVGFALVSASTVVGTITRDSSSDITATVGATAGSGELSLGVTLTDVDNDGFTELNISGGLAAIVGLQGGVAIESGVIDVAKQGIIDGAVWLFTWW